MAPRTPKYNARFLDSINPTAWLFLISLLLFFAGIVLPNLSFLALVGGFIVSLYVIVWVVWVWSNV